MIGVRVDLDCDCRPIVIKTDGGYSLSYHMDIGQWIIRYPIGRGSYELHLPESTNDEAMARKWYTQAVQGQSYFGT